MAKGITIRNGREFVDSLNAYMDAFDKGKTSTENPIHVATRDIPGLTEEQAQVIEKQEEILRTIRKPDREMVKEISIEIEKRM